MFNKITFDCTATTVILSAVLQHHVQRTSQYNSEIAINTSKNVLHAVKTQRFNSDAFVIGRDERGASALNIFFFLLLVAFHGTILGFFILMEY